jgi:hypothetical protein
VDSSGHIPIPVIIGAGILILKVVDYGWTAWDTYQSLRVVSDPQASAADKDLAYLNIALALSMELAEPDDILPVGVPLDDLGRKGTLKAAKEALESGTDDIPDWLRPMLRGVRTERRMLEKLGWVKNRKTVKGFVDDKWMKTVPDFLDKEAKIIGEIKDVGELWGTKQIKAQLAFAEQQGYMYYLHVRGDTEVAQWLLDLWREADWFEIVWDVVSEP